MSQLSPVNLNRALLWQHESAEKLKALVMAEQEDFDARVNNFYTDWVHDVFNVDTANEFGLGIWARILKVNLGISKPKSNNKRPFAFGNKRGNFGATFATSKSGYYGLTVEQKRLIVKLRYAQLTTRPSAIAINEVINSVFKNYGTVFVRDTLSMEFIEYVFGFGENYFIRQVLENFNLLPRPSGVGVKYSFDARDPWGFEIYNENFDNGNFIGSKK